MLRMNQLIGFGGRRSVEVLDTLSQQASAISTSDTITMPTVQAGDLIILLQGAGNISGIPTTVLPSGFTNIIDNGAGNTRVKIDYKISNGTESGATVTGMNGTLVDDKVIVTFRGNIPITVATPADASMDVTTSDPAAQVVNASGQTPPLVVLGAYFSTGTIDPRTMSPAKDGEVSSGSTGCFLAWKIYNSSPADVTVDMDDEFTNGLGSCYISCS